MLKTSLVLIPASLFLVLGACSKSATPSPDNLESSPSADRKGADGAIETPSAAEGVDQASLETVYFEYDSANLSSSTRQALSSVADKIKKNSKVKIQIEGHCDERGSNEYNLALGERRAQTVQEFLITEGISPNNLSTISYGEERPAQKGTSEGAWAKNRRAEFKPL